MSGFTADELRAYEVTIAYRDHGGAVRLRRISPMGFEFGVPLDGVPTWLLTAHDHEEGAVYRFDMRHVHAWLPASHDRGVSDNARDVLGNAAEAVVALGSLPGDDARLLRHVADDLAAARKSA